MKNKQINTVFTVVLLFFTVFIVIPVFVMVKNSLTAGGHFSFINFYNVFTQGKLASAFWNSTKVSFISAIITTILAFVLAYTESFTNIPLGLKKTLRTLAVFPMLLFFILQHPYAVIDPFYDRRIRYVICLPFTAAGPCCPKSKSASRSVDTVPVINAYDQRIAAVVSAKVRQAAPRCRAGRIIHRINTRFR